MRHENVAKSLSISSNRCTQSEHISAHLEVKIDAALLKKALPWNPWITIWIQLCISDELCIFNNEATERSHHSNGNDYS